MKKYKLPKDWIVVNSKSRPDRVYFFNVKTNERSWEEPTAKDSNKISSTKVQRSEKATDDNKNFSTERATTPEDDILKSASSDRRKLRAKRRLQSLEKNKTPQMRQIQEKILQKKSSVSTKNSNKLSVSATLKTDEKDKASTSAQQPDVQDTNLTPQMRAIIEKIQQKTSKSSTSKTHSAGNVVDATASKPTKKFEKKIWLTRASTQILTNRRSDSHETSTVNLKTQSGNKSKTVSDDNMEVAMIMSKENDVANTSQKNISGTSAGTSGVVRRKKNLAKRRMETLRKSLNSENSDDASSNSKKVRRMNKSLPSLSDNNVSLPNIYTDAEVRLHRLHERVLGETTAIKGNANVLMNADEENASLQSCSHDITTTVDKLIKRCGKERSYEEMDWEPLGDEKITHEVQAVRTELCTNIDIKCVERIPENTLTLSLPSEQQEIQILYIVIDTNVLLSNMQVVEYAKTVTFKSYGKTVIVIPWTVIRELDYIKDNKSMKRPESLQAKARSAVRFLYQHFSAKDSRIVGQTADDMLKNKERYAADCPDDEILQTCLQIRELGKPVVLLSYDQNLCNKAMIYDIVTLGRNDPFEKVDYLYASESQSASLWGCNTQATLTIGNDDSTSSFMQELRMSQEILEDAKAVIKHFLTVVVVKEMQNLYGDYWERFISVRPPWTAMSILKCALKHWMAAVSESFHRQAEPILKELLQLFNDLTDDNRTLKKVAHLLGKCNDLIQMVHVEKYPDLMARASNSIDDLKKRCRDYEGQINRRKLAEEIGMEDNPDERESKATKGFKHFETIYAYTRDFCGMAAAAAGMPCSFSYKPLNPAPTSEFLERMQPEIAANVNRLLHNLSTALEQVRISSVDHRTVISLYQALTTSLPDVSTAVLSDLTPLDVYCCLVEKEQMLRMGIRQLQELSTHFCRLASFKCM